MEKKTIMIYKKVLSGELSKFPYGFWNEKDGIRVNAVICVKYLFDEILKWSDEDIKNNFKINILREYRLYGLLEYYNNSAFSLLNDIYPNKFYPWEMKCVPMGYWEDRDNRIKAITWLYIKLNVDSKNMKNKFTVKNFQKYGLGALLESKYRNSPFLALDELFPNKYKVWEVSRVSRGYWLNIENCRMATIWLINKLDLSDEELNKKLSKELFYKYGLGSMLKTAYKDSPYLAIYDILPKKKKT